ncbi:MAG TPA: methyltransferase [Nocardioides sp.]|nr:methyltransferase [Nocardioides sp.]
MTATPLPELPHRLRAALVVAGFTYDAVAEVLGPVAHDALARNETTPGLRRTTGGWPLETLIRLFLLQAPVELAAAERALPGLVDRLAAEGFLEQTVGEVAARLDVRPYATDDEHLWVVSDLTPGLDGGSSRVGPDHVLGISSASTSLAQLTIRDPVERSLDLGTGCGVQALHLARHSGAVVATDVNRRALRLARFNASLNDVAAAVDVREGSFFEPVAGERFDLIATNPPFVISPATGERLVYRDSGLPGDRVVEDIVRGAPDHLTDGGWCQVLANWVIAAGVPWDERLAGWIPEGTDGYVVQREVVDPASYVELWLKDAGLHGSVDYLVRYDTWLSWFEEQGIEAVGFGWINLHRTGSSRRELLEWPYDVEQPIAPAIRDWADAAAARVDLGSRLTAHPDVRQETLGAPGAEDPETVVLRQQRGLRRARRVDTVEAALVGACDGELTVGQILDALAQLLDRDPAETRETYLPVARGLVAEGFLEA